MRAVRSIPVIRVEDLQLGMIAYVSDDRPPGIINAITKKKGEPLLSFRITSNYGEFWRYDCNPHDKVEAYTVHGFLREFHAIPRTTAANVAVNRTASSHKP